MSFRLTTPPPVSSRPSASESSDCAADAGASGPERPTAPSATAATEAVAIASGLRHWARTVVCADFCLGFTCLPRACRYGPGRNSLRRGDRHEPACTDIKSAEMDALDSRHFTVAQTFLTGI